MKTSTILFGPSGSGKTTWCRLNCQQAFKISSDDQLLVGGRYHWTPERMGSAHRWCLGTYMRHLLDHEKDVVVDNAFSHSTPAGPYVLCALATGWTVKPVVMAPSPDGYSYEEAVQVAARNQHGVPESKVLASAKSITYMLRNWPPGWPDPLLVDPFRDLSNSL